MYRSLLHFLLLPAIVFCVSSCSGDKAYTHIPEDAAFVLAADFKNLALDALSLKSLLSQTTDTAKKPEVDRKFQNPGIDFLGTGFLFRTEQNRGKEQVFAILPLDDADDFRAFVKGLDSRLTITSAYDMEWLKGEDFLIGIKGKIAVGLLGEPGPDAGSRQEYLASLTSLPEDKQLIHQNPRFKALKDKGFDAGIWVNTGKAFEVAALPMAGALKQGGGEVYAAIDFRDGKISVSGEGFNEDPDMKTINACFSQNLDDDFLTSLPMEKPAGVLAWRMDLGKLLAGMEKTSLGEGVQENITQSGFSKDDVFGALTGQMALAMAGMPAEGSFLPSIHFSAEIADAGKLRKVLSQLAFTGLMTPAGENTWIAGLPSLATFRVKTDDKILSISNTSGETAESFHVSEAGEREKGNFYMMADLRKLSTGLPPDSKQESLQTLSETWTGITGWGRLENETTMSFGATLTSAFPDENALLTLGKSVRNLNNKSRENREMEMPVYPGADSTAAVTDTIQATDWQVQ